MGIGYNMPSNFKDKMNKLYNSASIPFLILLIAFVPLFFFQDGLNRFLPGTHGSLSSHGMTLAANLSIENHFLMFDNMTLNEDHTIQYASYNRFPIGAFAALKLLTLPFHSDPSMQIYVARMLMISFFFLAACFAYISIFRLSKSRWVAITATLLTFSSYYCLKYNDMIFNDIPTLFGLLLTFHGMVVFMQEDRFAQLLIKSCAALLLGWQIYAILLPFTFLGCIKEMIKSQSIYSFVRNRFFVLGIFSLLFGTAILASNLIGECLALNIPLKEIPSFKMMLWRTGLSPIESYAQYAANFSWPIFLDNQLFQIGKMSIPHILDHFVGISQLLKFFGGGVLVISFVVAVIARQKLLMISLVVSGLCWALPMRYFVMFHEFQYIFYIGIPITLFSILALLTEKLSKILVISFACASLAVFLLSSVHMNTMKAVGADTNNIVITDFQRIRNYVGTGQTIFVDVNPYSIGDELHAIDFYLARNYFQPTPETADFIISIDKIENLTLLTPQNQKIFLYNTDISNPLSM